MIHNADVKHLRVFLGYKSILILIFLVVKNVLSNSDVVKVALVKSVGVLSVLDFFLPFRT